VQLETRPANVEGKGEVTIRDLVRNALRMRPNRIIIGECRGAEAVDMLQAMNTGHDGSLTTLHANAPRDALTRLEMMFLMAGMDIPLHAVREHVASAVDLVIQVDRLPGGVRRVTSVTEILKAAESGESARGDFVPTRELFRFHQTAVDSDGRAVGEFQASGAVPDFLPKLTAGGITLPSDMFEARVLATV
jgi:pilus assembly protein CpaF